MTIGQSTFAVGWENRKKERKLVEERSERASHHYQLNYSDHKSSLFLYHKLPMTKYM